jgi:hypothetical protein
MPVTMISPTGARVEVGDDEVAAALQSGYRAETVEQDVQRIADESRSERYGGVTGKITAATMGALRGASLGLSDVAIGQLGGGDGRSDLRKLRDENPLTSLGGEIVGAIATAIPSGGTSLLARAPAAAAARLGARVAQTAEGASTVARVGRAVAGGATEGAIVGAGQSVSEIALSDKPLTVEQLGASLSSNMLYGSLTGGAVGGAAKGFEIGLGRARKAIDDFKTRGDAADALPDDLATMDVKQLRAAREIELDTIKAARVAEKETVEQARVIERKAVADELGAHHQAIDADKPWLATRGSAEAEIRTIGKQLLNANRQLRNMLDNPKFLAEKPQQALAGLQKQEHALEQMLRVDGRLRRTFGAGDDAHIPTSADDLVEDAVTSVPARDLKARGYIEQPGAGVDKAKMDKARKAIADGQRDPITIAVSPGGRLDIGDGRHRLLAAIEADAPIKVRWQAGSAGLDNGLPPLKLPAPPGARAAALDTVPAALERNRALQARIRETTAEIKLATPDVTPRLQQIDEARELLASGGGQKSIAEQALSGSVFSGVAGVVSAVPVIGPMLAPLIGARAAKLVEGGVFGRAGRATSEIAKRGARAVDALLSAGQTISRLAPPLATKTLLAVRFAPEDKATKQPKRADLAKLYHARSSELRSQTMYAQDGSIQMRPDARAQVAARLDPIRAVDPLAADQLETIAARRVEFLASKLPRRPDIGGIPLSAADRWRPSEMEMRQFARYVAAVEDPMGIVERVADGSVTPSDTEVMRSVYPEMYADITQQIVSRLPELRTSLPYRQRLALSRFTGEPIDASMHPRILAVLQAQHAQEAGTQGGTQAPTPQPKFGAFGSPKAAAESDATRAQRRSA